MQKIVSIASKITAVPQRDLGIFYEQQILQKALFILTKKDHILNQEFVDGNQVVVLDVPFVRRIDLRTLLCQSQYAF